MKNADVPVYDETPNDKQPESNPESAQEAAHPRGATPAKQAPPVRKAPPPVVRDARRLAGGAKHVSARLLAGAQPLATRAQRRSAALADQSRQRFEGSRGRQYAIDHPLRTAAFAFAGGVFVGGAFIAWTTGAVPASAPTSGTQRVSQQNANQNLFDSLVTAALNPGSQDFDGQALSAFRASLADGSDAEVKNTMAAIVRASEVNTRFPDEVVNVALAKGDRGLLFAQLWAVAQGQDGDTAVRQIARSVALSGNGTAGVTAVDVMARGNIDRPGVQAAIATVMEGLSGQTNTSNFRAATNALIEQVQTSDGQKDRLAAWAADAAEAKFGPDSSEARSLANYVDYLAKTANAPQNRQPFVTVNRLFANDQSLLSSARSS